MKTVRNLLLPDPEELLTTLMLMLVNMKTKQGIVLLVADGLVCINGKLTKLDHDNPPDYLGCHLGEDFEAWYASQNLNILCDNILDVSIATDGISLFSPFRDKATRNAMNAIEYLLLDRSGAGDEDMLNRKLNKLEHELGLKPTDDIAIVRLLC